MITDEAPKMELLTESMLLTAFHSVGRGLPCTTSHTASIRRFLYLTSTVGNLTPTLQNNLYMHGQRSNKVKGMQASKEAMQVLKGLLVYSVSNFS
jgi:hypothetical protein